MAKLHLISLQKGELSEAVLHKPYTCNTHSTPWEEIVLFLLQLTGNFCCCLHPVIKVLK